MAMALGNDILFSVIIPAYNAAETIGRAIDSVLAQSYPYYEIIVIDDASTDDTKVVVQQYGDKVQLIEKLFNTGGSGARNAGMDVAKGQYIAFLDADDVWHKDKLMLMEAILSANPNISLLYHPYTLESLEGKAIPEDIRIFKLPFIKLLPGNIIATPCVTIKNDPSFRFEPGMRYTEDYDLWMQIGYKHKLYFINIPLTQIGRPVLSKGGVSANKWAMRKGEMRAYARLTKLNPAFILMLPMLLVASLGKHVVKMVVR